MSRSLFLKTFPSFNHTPLNAYYNNHPITCSNFSASSHASLLDWCSCLKPAKLISVAMATTTPWILWRRRIHWTFTNPWSSRMYEFENRIKRKIIYLQIIASSCFLFHLNICSIYLPKHFAASEVPQWIEVLEKLWVNEISISNLYDCLNGLFWKYNRRSLKM